MIIYTLGTYVQEIGFVVRNAKGFVVYEMKAGTKWGANAIIGNFTPEAVNLGVISDISNNLDKDGNPILPEII